MAETTFRETASPTTSYEHLTAEPVAGSLGAVIGGVDLLDMSDTQFADVHQALLDHEVIFFRNQPMTAQQQLALAGRFGNPSIFPVSALLGATEPSTSEIVDDADSPPTTDAWHTDVTWVAAPPKVAILTALEVPERGGDTMWASTTTAYDALSPAMQDLLFGLTVTHDCWPGFCATTERKAGVPGLGQRIHEAFPPVQHPLIRTHPETERRAIYFGSNFMSHIDGLNEAESSAFIDFLARHLDQPRFHCRWKWSPNDIAIWDERSTVHRGVSDHFPQRRVVRRCVVDGDAPA